MLWMHAFILFAASNPPQCTPGDLERFPHTGYAEMEVATYQGGNPRVWHTKTVWSSWKRMSVQVAYDRIEWLNLQMSMSRTADEWFCYQQQIDEQYELIETWQMLDTAWSYREYYDCDPSLTLERLRERIGIENYAAGRMPPLIPCWRYTEMDP